MLTPPPDLHPADAHDFSPSVERLGLREAITMCAEVGLVVPPARIERIVNHLLDRRDQGPLQRIESEMYFRSAICEASSSDAVTEPYP